VWHYVSFSTALVAQLQLWCPYRLRATCLHTCCGDYTSCLMETAPSLYDAEKDNTAHIPVQQYQLDYYKFRQLRACHCILHHVALVTNNMVEKCVTPYDGDISRIRSQDICCTTFFTCFLTRNHTLKSFCLNLSLCTLMKCTVYLAIHYSMFYVFLRPKRRCMWYINIVLNTAIIVTLNVNIQEVYNVLQQHSIVLT
jgi:hypothetical protein